MSIKSPGVSPKIHTFCQSLGRDSGWNRAEAGVRKRCLRLPVAQSLGVQWQAGFLLRSTLAFPGAEITRVCLNLQKRGCGPEATACELTIQLKCPPPPIIPSVGDTMRLITVLALQSQHKKRQVVIIRIGILNMDLGAADIAGLLVILKGNQENDQAIYFIHFNMGRSSCSNIK